LPKPLGHAAGLFDARVLVTTVNIESVIRADDGIRTRDPHLGKVMRYQLRYVRVGTKYVPADDSS
jgi:hypothetical protein